MWSARLFFALIALTIWTTSHAKEKIALIIGNADYASSALVNSVNDAEDIASVLKGLGFSVTLVKNASYEELETSITEFVSSLDDDTVGLFYYSGHAVQYKGSNYLVPIGSVGKVDQASDLTKYTVSTNTVLDGLNQSQSNLNFVFLDACRDNPFKNLGKEISPGLAKTSVGTKSTSPDLTMEDVFTTRGVSETHEQVKDTKGILVAYSTMPGNVASDGRGRNSPYTESLLKHISKTNSLAQIMLSDVQQDVQETTNGQQIPIFESAITGRFCFNEANNGCGKAVVNIYSAYLKGVKDIQKLTFPSGLIYEGQAVDGKPYGNGVALYENGSRYEGEYKNGEKHGKGFFYYSNGDVYDGHWLDDKEDGFGVARWSNGERYEGQWKNGKQHGNGVAIYEDGSRYEGGHKNGKQHGHGVRTEISGTLLESEYESGYPNGQSKITMTDGFTFEFNLKITEEIKGLFDDLDKLDEGVKSPKWTETSNDLAYSIVNLIDGEVSGTHAEYTYKGGFKYGKRNGKGEIRFKDGSSYKGGIFNGKAHGEGVRVGADGGRYKGGWYKDRRDGFGIQDYENGSRYRGKWKNSRYNGDGVIFYGNGDTYKGIFVNHNFHGKGIYTWASGDQYDGNWAAGIKNGFGIHDYANGGRYEGDYKNGEKHGKGIYTWASGDHYEGEYEDGEQHGKGIHTWANGKRFQGEWKNGKRHGKGIQTWANGDRYEGEWKDGEQHGKGIYKWVDDGGRYEGEWKDGEQHGKGIYKWADGGRYEGEWKDGEQHGKGIHTWANGKRFQGEWKNGKMVN